MTAVFEEATSTTHNKVTDAILMWTDIGEGDLETMLGREPWTGNPTGVDWENREMKKTQLSTSHIATSNY